jgi:hypothetical protein
MSEWEWIVHECVQCWQAEIIENFIRMEEGY